MALDACAQASGKDTAQPNDWSEFLFVIFERRKLLQ